MIIVIPLMCVLYHRNHSDGEEHPSWYSMIPLFIVGFACMSLLRTIGDMGDRPFGLLSEDQWQWLVGQTKSAAELLLAIAMASVGLGTKLKDLVAIGLKPLGVGLFSALLVGAVSIGLISLFY